MSIILFYNRIILFKFEIIMKIVNYPQIQAIIEAEFPNFRKTVRKNFSLTTLSLLQSDTCSLPDIALQMTKINQNDHNTNLIRLSRFLKSSEFQIGDKEWRMFIKFVFNLLKEGVFISKGDMIPINVDYTSSTDKFLILTASIPFYKRGIPIYFSMRLYPKKKGMIDMKKMEKAFIKELAYILPDGYKYVIISDRGFGCQRFAELCLEYGFDYILRISKFLNLEVNGENKKIRDVKEDADYEIANITAKKWQTRLVVSMNKDKKKDDWYLVTSLSEVDYKKIINSYKKRFGIEKMFQDEKGSGFNIEKTKIIKYMRFKRLLFCILFTQVLLMFIGNYIINNVDEIKKNYRLHIGIVSVFSSSQEELVKYFL